MNTAAAAEPAVVLADANVQGAEAAVAAEESAGMVVRARRSSRMSLALILLATIALIAALYFARAFFVPLLIGILASYTLSPVVDWMQALRIPRPIGAALVLALLVGGISWIGYAVGDEAAVMIEKLPDAARKLRQTLSPVRNAAPTALQNVQEAANELQAVAADAGRKTGTHAPAAPEPDSSSWLRNYALAQSATLVSIAAQAPIVLLLAYFLLASGDHFRRKLIQFVGPSLSRKKDALHILHEIDTQVQRYLFATLASNALIGVGTWLAFEALGMEQAGIWGVLAGVLHFIPYLGPVIVAIAAGVAGFLQFGSLLHGLAIAGVAILIAGLIGLGFMTWLQSRFARVNAAVLFIALLFFGWLWGIAGLLLGAPLLAIAKVICDRVESLNPAGELLGR
jgi:predicted PurR-regulated permease PerM